MDLHDLIRQSPSQLIDQTDAGEIVKLRYVRYVSYYGIY